MIRGDTTTIPYEIEPLGEQAVLIRFGETIDLRVHYSVMAVHQKLEGQAFTGFIEAVPSYAAITVHYDPVLVYKSRNMKEQCHETIFETVRTRLCTLLDDCTAALSTQDVKEIKLAQRIVIPVCYGGEYGPDLALVAEHCRKSEEEVIRLHSSSEYLVYMIGFAPGFPYLGGMNEKIAMPRRSEPRAITPAGSVGIAGAQTGVYPYATPGGWQIIGRSPLKLFDPEQEQPSYLRAGQQISFEPISPKEYKALAKDERGDNA